MSTSSSRQDGPVQARIDLDEAAHQITIRRAEWVAAGLTVSQTTWREEGEFPPVLKTVRQEIANPDSIGIQITKDKQEGSVVLFKGGWADLLWWSGASPEDCVEEAPGWGNWLDIEDFAVVLDRLGSMFS